LNELTRIVDSSPAPREPVRHAATVVAPEASTVRHAPSARPPIEHAVYARVLAIQVELVAREPSLVEAKVEPTSSVTAALNDERYRRNLLTEANPQPEAAVRLANAAAAYAEQRSLAETGARTPGQRVDVRA